MTMLAETPKRWTAWRRPAAKEEEPGPVVAFAAAVEARTRPNEVADLGKAVQAC